MKLRDRFRDWMERKELEIMEKRILFRARHPLPAYAPLDYRRLKYLREKYPEVPNEA